MRPDQIRQLASAFTNLGVGMILAAIVAPAARQARGRWARFRAAWCVV
jgi:hypothetical protein